MMGLISLPPGVDGAVDLLRFPCDLTIGNSLMQGLISRFSCPSSNAVIGSSSSLTSIGSILTFTGAIREGGTNRFCRTGGVEVDGDGIELLGIYAVSYLSMDGQMMKAHT